MIEIEKIPFFQFEIMRCHGDIGQTSRRIMQGMRVGMCGMFVAFCGRVRDRFDVFHFDRVGILMA